MIMLSCRMFTDFLFSRFNAGLAVQRNAILNGIYDPHTNIMQYPKSMQPTHARWEQINDNEVKANCSLTNGHNNDQTILPPVDPVLSRNYMVIDTVYESPPVSNLGIPGPDGGIYDIGFNGLSDISDDIKADLPPECLKAFEEALAKERNWKSQWRLESQNTLRRAPKIDKGPMA
jgi:chromatin structure-remodeling complex protein RSC7